MANNSFNVLACEHAVSHPLRISHGLTCVPGFELGAWWTDDARKDRLVFDAGFVGLLSGLAAAGAGKGGGGRNPRLLIRCLDGLRNLAIASRPPGGPGPGGSSDGLEGGPDPAGALSGASDARKSAILGDGPSTLVEVRPPRTPAKDT